MFTLTVCGEGQTSQSGCKARSADVRLSTLDVFKYPADEFRKQITQDMIFGATSKSKYYIVVK